MSLHAIFRRHFRLVILGLIALAAMLEAKGVVVLAFLRLAPEAEALAAPPPAPPGRQADPLLHAISADAIVARNPFDHATSLIAAAPIDEIVLAPASIEPRDAPPCDGVKALVITASTDPDWSFAALSSTEEPRAVFRRRGNPYGKKTVNFIGWDRVWFDQGGGVLCQAELFRPAADPSAKPDPKVAATPTVSAAGPGLPADITSGIVRKGPTEVWVDRGVLERIIANQHLFMSTTRIQPVTVDGRVAGLKMFGVKPGTLLGLLGLEDGDRLDTINNYEMGSPESALQAFAHLREADRLAVKINRGGKDMTLDVVIK